MKSGIHPDYRPVVFYDTATGTGFLTRSTINSDERISWEDGQEYPLVRVDISSASHPFWTGNQRVIDTAGQIEKFRRRYGDTSMQRRRAARNAANPTQLQESNDGSPQT